MFFFSGGQKLYFQQMERKPGIWEDYWKGFAGVPIKIYSSEKTIADCFKFRNRIGMDVVLEALALCRTRKNFDMEALLYYGKICRVERVMVPYLEASV